MSYSYLFKYIIIGDTGACLRRCVLCWEQCSLASTVCLGSLEPCQAFIHRRRILVRNISAVGVKYVPCLHRRLVYDGPVSFFFNAIGLH
jgi:hypothetical protein